MGSGWSKVGQAAGSLVVLMLLLLCLCRRLPTNCTSSLIALKARRFTVGLISKEMFRLEQRCDRSRDDGQRTRPHETDDKGKFTFTAREHVDHCLVGGNTRRPQRSACRALLRIAGRPARERATKDRIAQAVSQTTNDINVRDESASKESELALSGINWLNYARSSGCSGGRFPNPTSGSVFATF